MDSKRELFEKIEMYLGGHLNDQEKADFEKELIADESLRKEMDIHREASEALATPSNAEFRATLKEVGKEIAEENAIEQPGARRKLWSLAAAIAVISILTVVLLTRSNSVSLYEEYYQPYPAKSITRGETPGADAEVYLHYARGNFNQAKDQFERLVANHPEEVELNIYLGICYQELGNSELAINTLQKIDFREDYGDDAAWYLAIIYLKADQPEDARVQLEMIAASQSKHTSNAAKILKEL